MKHAENNKTRSLLDSRGRKFKVFLGRVVVMTVLFAAAGWLFDYFFDGKSSLDWTLLPEGLVFSIIMVLMSDTSPFRKKK